MDASKEDPEALYHETSAHLAVVERDPATILDTDLLRRTERSLTRSTPQSQLWKLLETGERLLQTLEQDPRPLTRLLEAIIALIPFDSLRLSTSTSKLEQGLIASPPVQLLCLAYLRKASDIPSGAAFIASSGSLVARLVTVWLSTEATEVSDHALTTIVTLLTVDKPDTVTVVTVDDRLGEAHGQGLLWRRIFHDPQIYGLLFSHTTLDAALSSHDLSSKKGRQAVTLAQARLFDFIARIAELDWAAITTSSLPQVEAAYIKSPSSTNSVYGGLLAYAASSMIDQSDLLLDVLRQEFFLKLLGIVEDGATGTRVSPMFLLAIKSDAGFREGGETNGASNGLHL